MSARSSGIDRFCSAGTSGNFAGWAVIFASAAFGDFVRSHYAAKVLYALIDIYRKEEGGQTPVSPHCSAMAS